MNLNKKKIDQLLRSRFSNGFLTLKDLPPPDQFFGMQKACTIIKHAIKQGKKITVVGDYDVDGVISTAVMQRFFDHIGYEIQTVIPNRFSDGYGLSQKVIDRIDAELIITVDNGISAEKAADLCKEKEMELIITDHHTPPSKLPKADAIVNPKLHACEFRYSEICGAQVAWYLVAYLNKMLDAKFDIKSLIADVSIAVIADVMPLKEINRTFVKAGLQLLSQSKRPYVQALKQFMAKQNFSSEDVGFFIAPRLNSAGRMDDATIALEFILAKDVAQASLLLQQLNSFNSYRKDVQADILQQAKKQVDTDDSVIVVAGNWHEGVIGIVASALAQEYKKPAIVFSKGQNVYKASARSFADIDLFALIKRYEDLLVGFGGHKAAAGLSVDKDMYETFSQQIKKSSYPKPNEKSLCVGELAFDMIDWELLEILQRYEPYGEQNPKPRFFTSGVRVKSSKRVGEQKEHTIYYLQKGYHHFKAIAFNSRLDGIENRSIDIEYSVEKNSFQNRSSIQLSLVKINL